MSALELAIAHDERSFLWSGIAARSQLGTMRADWENKECAAKISHCASQGLKTQLELKSDYY